MDILGFVEELQALEELNKAREKLEKDMESGKTMLFPDPTYEAKLTEFVRVTKFNRRG